MNEGLLYFEDEIAFLAGLYNYDWFKNNFFVFCNGSKIIPIPFFILNNVMAFVSPKLAFSIRPKSVCVGTRLVFADFWYPA